MRAVLPLALLFACAHEGKNPGDCTDGLDNDNDGLFDCDDDDCIGTWECDNIEKETGDTDTETDTDTDTDADGDTDSDADTDTSFGSGDEYFVDPCGVTFTYEQQGSPDKVWLAGSFNDWTVGVHEMTKTDGKWSILVDKEDIPPGVYSYKFVEESGGTSSWTCDPNAGMIQCDQYYKDVNDTTWHNSCTLGNNSCNSMIVVPDYDTPRLVLTDLDFKASTGKTSVEIEFREGCSGQAASTWKASLDDTSIDVWNGDGFSYSDTLSKGRHTLRFEVTDAGGKTTEESFIPLWVEDNDGWERGLMYYAFVDRFINGDTTNDWGEGACEMAEYRGGDFQGVIDALPYLEDLGVNVIWVSNPQDNAEGDWAGDCSCTYSGYHGYWPDDAYGVEEHFGGKDAFKALVEEAHARDMRVVMDWVGNHVHQNHAWYAEHPYDWFNTQVLCKIGDDYSNFDLIPETCWFAEYLPDINFYNPYPLAQAVEDAVWWVKTYDLDGFRVDGAKHVPHSVVWNLETRLDQEVEHRYAGGNTEFYTVGETYATSRDWVAAFVNDDELDAQFDFPLYFTIRDAFISDSAGLNDLVNSLRASDAAYGGALMSTFLGNHDVTRFTTAADGAGSPCDTASPVSNEWWYDRLALGWTFLLTNPGLPMIYYGDELGMPGNMDPDNRQPFWWYSSAINTSTNGEFDLQDLSNGLYHSQMGTPLWALSTLGQARSQHPAFYSGSTSYCSETWDLIAYSRKTDSDAIFVAINRSYQDAPTNCDPGLSGSFKEIFSGTTVDGSSLNGITVPGNSALVYVKQ